MVSVITKGENGAPFRNRTYSLPNNYIGQGYNCNADGDYGNLSLELRPNNEFNPSERDIYEWRSQGHCNNVYVTSSSATTEGNISLENAATSTIDERPKPIRTGRNIFGDYRYVDLIEMAINTSPQQQLTLNQIYSWIQASIKDINERTNGESSWKNSVRHSLSLQKHFIRKKFNGTHYWTIDYNKKPKDCDKRRPNSLNLQQLEELREGDKQFFMVHNQQLPSIPSQDMLLTESYEGAVSYCNENTEKPSKIAHGFKKGVKKYMQKIKQVITKKSSEKYKLIRTQSLRENRSSCEYVPPSYNYTCLEHQMPYQMNCEKKFVPQYFPKTFTNVAYYTEQHPQLSRSNSDTSNEFYNNQSTNPCTNVNFSNEYTTNFIDNHNIEAQNNYISNQMTFNPQYSRPRSNTVSSTSSDYKQDWHYFQERPETEFENHDGIISNRTTESDNLNVLACELQSSVTLQPINEAVLKSEDNGYYNQQCNSISSTQSCQFPVFNDNNTIDDIDGIAMRDLFVPVNSRQ
ncbi:uncharacterized protein LOC130446507 isoform X1 [Diorhabda sublineata]|uniref:uncharacterized protein LOC130446507 isoform X1 n=1 Tax=Diorhabda sublineata TaxID=1163346 RepID=UPI0024E0C5AB|nr:uncharacterized protein LOC130446507 isoform X1 [Diorhabda sublineata]